MTTSNITVSPLTPAIGAEIGNVDLGQVTGPRNNRYSRGITQAQSGIF
jgi:hypothetical protein